MTAASARQLIVWVLSLVAFAFVAADLQADILYSVTNVSAAGVSVGLNNLGDIAAATGGYLNVTSGQFSTLQRPAGAYIQETAINDAKQLTGSFSVATGPIRAPSTRSFTQTGRH